MFIYVYYLIIYETNNISLQKLDPAQFVRAYGRPCKINLDPAVAYAAESPQSMSVLAWNVFFLGNVFFYIEIKFKHGKINDKEWKFSVPDSF